MVSLMWEQTCLLSFVSPRGKKKKKEHQGAALKPELWNGDYHL